MIVSFGCGDTARLAAGQRVLRFRQFERVAMRKLLQLEVAEVLSDLRTPPGNHLERLQGDWAGYHSIRINRQFRMCFRWTSLGPDDVQILDYH
jgi:proteic killer suppression protein